MGKTQIFTGSAPAVVTPMNADGSVNFEAFGKLVDFVVEGGSDAVVVCGTTGEASSMDDTEHLAVIEHCVKTVNKRVPVIAGTGSNDTRHAINLSKEAANRGADALLQVTPYYNKTNQTGLVRHFTTVAEAAGLPVILYNVPSRTGMSIAVDTYRELAKHPLIVATKEATGDISFIANVADACGDDLAIYSGNDDQVLPILALGGIGVISVVGNVMPREMHDLCHLYFAGRADDSRKLQLSVLALNNALFCEVNPIPVKEAVNMMGIAAGPCRMPLGEMSAANRERLSAEMQKYGLVK